MPYQKQHNTKRNVALLSFSQAALITGSSLLLASSAIVGLALVDNKSLATLPLALLFLAQMTTTIPASLYMARVGRRMGFMTSAMFGLTGAAVATAGVFKADFGIFCTGTTLIGVFNGFGQYYRFTAAEVAVDDYRSRAISYVLAGGVIAAFAGPNLANWSRHSLPADFAGSYASLIGLYLLALGFASFLRIPKPAAFSLLQGGRPLRPPACLSGGRRQRHGWVWYHEFYHDRHAAGHEGVCPCILGHGICYPVACIRDVCSVFFHRPFDTALRHFQYHADGDFTAGFVRLDKFYRNNRHPFLGGPDFIGAGLEFSICWRNRLAYRNLFPG